LTGLLNPTNTEVNAYQVAWDFLVQHQL
jgi:hypothetical protein